MERVRTILGLVVGALLLLSAGAHSLLGGPTVRGELDKVAAGPDLMRTVEIGWLWGGFAMAAFGVIVIAHFVRRMRGAVDAAFPVALIAAVYVAFGLWALVTTGFDPFFLVFVVPGVLLAVALPRGAAPGR